VNVCPTFATDKPVTQTADVAINNESTNPMEWKSVVVNGITKNMVPAIIMLRKLTIIIM
jgi:formylmethanofuran dehydrogenase subunit E-like metal-binding protein